MLNGLISPFHVAKRSGLPTSQAAVYRLLAVVLALVTGGLFIWALGHNPFDVYGTMITGATGSVSSLRETAKIAIPLCITALAVTLAFKMRFWNIGAEGQICIGAVAAAFFAINFTHWPQIWLLLAMAAAGMIAGAIWGLIPAYFKAKYNTNETLFTLMMNYVALYVIQILREGPWKDPNSGFPKVPMFNKVARIPSVFGVHIGWIVALILVVLVFIYLRYTKQGYELSVVGENERTASYAGMRVSRIILRTMGISAALCGLVGMLQASGADKTLTDTVAGGVGFTAITIAWLSQLSPFGILITSILFAILEKGSGTVQSLFQISPAASEVLQGIILFFVLGAEFFVNYQLLRTVKGGARHA